MSTQPTDSQKPTTIPLDTYRPSTWKGRLYALVFAVLVLLCLGSALLGIGRSSFAPGGLSTAHATWEDRCDACHVTGTPIRGRALIAPVSFHNPDRCATCHGAPGHHPGRTEEPACATCHHEHQGRSASLVALADSHCTSCHANLEAHGDSQGRWARSVTRFDADRRHHPEFRPLRDPAEDPSKLRFNHALHLTPGLVKPNGRPFNLAGIEPKAQERFRRQQRDQRNEAPVELTCSSCHRLDGKAEAPAHPILARPAGQHMLPITYEDHCQACHPLRFDGRLADLAPHHVQPPEIHAFLERTYLARLLDPDRHPVLMEWFRATRPLPGRQLGKGEKDVRRLVDDLVGAAEGLLYRTGNRCSLCHFVEKDPSRIVPRRIPPTAVPTVWLEHAWFSHSAHRALDCLECHPQAQTSTTARMVLLPGIETCVQCHDEGRSSGTARATCTTCHHYHNGDDPLRGRGDPARDPGRKLDVRQFLWGKRDRE
jgi:predicted CXXCH cytochrome family protein